MDIRFVAVALAMGLSTSVLATPPNMHVAEYMARKKQITADYLVARSACGSSASTGSGKEICLATAMGKDHVAKADLEVDYRSTPRTQLEASEARVDAAFWIARERCADLAYTLQLRCVQDAKAAEVSAKADAKARTQAAEAKLIAAEDQALARARHKQVAEHARAHPATETQSASTK